MKASELRIGNWVNYQHEDENNDIQIGISELTEIEEGWEDYQPIPLTEEWLLKFGFEKCRDGSYNLEVGGLITRLSWYNCYVEMENYVNEELTPLMDKCKYVHQLQNLYFALTG